MTKEGYLRHLEAQLERVNDACDAAAHVQRQQEELERKLAALRELESQKAAAWVGLEQARERDAEALQDIKRRVEGVEKLSDRCVHACVSARVCVRAFVYLVRMKGLDRLINAQPVTQARGLGDFGRSP